mmetsp:Transcript_11590/g.24731  ORF Transcript_11590/g.24731 Transcript_11590/m.24731 type:complete len:365 (-) Transcript_11590:248-1342(-)
MDLTPKPPPPSTGSFFSCCRVEPSLPSKEEMAHQIDRLSNEIKYANEKNAALNTKLNIAENAATQMQNELNSNIKCLEADLLKSKQNSSDKSSEIASVKVDLESLHGKLADVTAAKDLEIENLQKELDSLRSSLIDAAAMRDEHSAENSSLQHQIGNLQNTMAEISATKDAEIGKLQKELESSQIEIAAARAEIDKLRKDLNSKKESQKHEEVNEQYKSRIVEEECNDVKKVQNESNSNSKAEGSNPMKGGDDLMEINVDYATTRTMHDGVGSTGHDTSDEVTNQAEKENEGKAVYDEAQDLMKTTSTIGETTSTESVNNKKKKKKKIRPKLTPVNSSEEGEEEDGHLGFGHIAVKSISQSPDD